MRQVKAAIPGVAVATLLCGVSLAFSGCGKKEKLEPATAPPTVSVIVVQPQDGPVDAAVILRSDGRRDADLPGDISYFQLSCDHPFDCA